jgi:hypothetical protein
MLNEDPGRPIEGATQFSAIQGSAIQSSVELLDSILERLVKSIGEECSQETTEYLANSRAEATGE